MTNARTQGKRRRARGYTSVEVLMAMTLFAIGAAGVISMQRATIQGGEDARRYDMATNIANEWISRLQRDSSYWTQPNSQFPDLMNISQTRWLRDVDTAPLTAFRNIPMPVAPADGLSPAFDNFGRDLPAGTTEATYCVQYRLQWIVAPGVGPGYPRPLQLTGLMRAEVRVYWARLERNAVGNCLAPPPEVIPAVSNFHMVYAATTIRESARR